MLCRILNQKQMERIPQASLRILEQTGVEMPYADMLPRFARADANVDLKLQRVRIPSRAHRHDDHRRRIDARRLPCQRQGQGNGGSGG